MTDAAPDPKARRLVWRAVQRFSEHCHAPDLSPGCPYYGRDVYTGQPYCAEECIDLLDEFGADEQSDAANVVISGDIGAHPHRQRGEEPAAPSRPFDARELTLRDRTLPIHRWGPTALFGYLIESVQAAIGDRDLAGARPYDTAAVVAALHVKGFDTALLTEATAANLAFMIVVLITVPGDNLHPALPQWRGVLHGSQGSPQLDFGADTPVEVDLAAAPKIAGWLASLPVNDMFDLRCPTDDEYLSATPLEANAERATTARWLFERFSQTYLEEWSPSSLRREWDWLQGSGRRIEPYATSMSTRTVDKAQLAGLLADQHCLQSDSALATTRLPSAAAFVNVAAGHLAAGRRDLAASLFDACRTTNPDDPHAHNNYGFCILPDDPAAALVSLQHAADLGLSNEPVNFANRVLALTRLGRYATAVQILNEITSDTWGQMPRAISFVWRADTDAGDDPVVIQTDPCDYLCDLAVSLAQITNDSELARAWGARRAARRQ